MSGPLLFPNLGEDVMHTLLVASSLVVLLISISAYAAKRTSRYFYLTLAFLFLLLGQGDLLFETLFMSDILIVVPFVGLHLAHLFDLLMILSFGLALFPRQVRGEDKSRLRMHLE